MSAIANQPFPPFVDRIVLRDVSWGTYERLLGDLEDCSVPRIAFDRGVLEIMTPHLEHEAANRAVAAIIEIALEEMDLDFESGGSATFKREDIQRGFEPDSCFYITNADRVRGQSRIDPIEAGPLDLVVEIDRTRISLGKFSVYAAFRVPEVWRLEKVLEIWTLEGDAYIQRESSLALPILTASFVTDLLESRPGMRRPEWLRQVRDRVRSRAR